MIMIEDIGELIYPWKWGPTDDGYGIIKTDSSFSLIKLDEKDLSLKDSYLVQYGIPKEWNIEPIVTSNDLESLIVNVINSEDEDDDLHYDDSELLSDKEKLVAKKYDLSVTEMAVINFYRLTTNKNPKIQEDQFESLEDLIIGDNFVRSLSVIINKDSKFVSNFLITLSDDQKKSVVVNSCKILSKNVNPMYGLNKIQTVLIQLYLSYHPEIPKPHRVKNFDVGYILNDLIKDNNFILTIGKIGKHVGLSTIILNGLNELLRLKLLKSFIKTHWEKLIGLK